MCVAFHHAHLCLSQFPTSWIFRSSLLCAPKSCIIPLWEDQPAACWRCSWSAQELCNSRAAHSALYREGDPSGPEGKKLPSPLTSPLASPREVGYVLGKQRAVCAQWRAAWCQEENYKYCKSAGCQTSQRQAERSASLNHVWPTVITKTVSSHPAMLQTIQQMNQEQERTGKVKSLKDIKVHNFFFIFVFLNLFP